MRVRLDANEAAENAASTIVEGIFVKEIARGMRRDVVLQCARVEFLLIFCDGDSEQKCSITDTFASSSVTSSRCGNTAAFSPWSQWKISMGDSISTPRGTKRKVPELTNA